MEAVSDVKEREVSGDEVSKSIWSLWSGEYSVAWSVVVICQT